MGPLFTIPYPEYCIANQLQALFPASQGFSLFVPASRQEKRLWSDLAGSSALMVVGRVRKKRVIMR